MKDVRTIKISKPNDLDRNFRLPVPRLLAQLWGTTSRDDLLAAMNIMLRRNRIIKGPVIGKYEQAFAKQVGVDYAYSFNSGRVALYGLLRAFGVGPGDEVLLQVPTHIVVANAIRYVGARPVYVDCELNTYNMDLDQAERSITPRTKVLLLQHTFGIPARPIDAQALAEKYGLTLIEDCVHALGARYDGRPLGSFGNAAFFSTEETKIISSTMGGMAVTNDPKLAERLALFQENCPWPSEQVVRRYILKLIVYHTFTHPYVHPYTHRVYMNLRRNPRTHLAPGATSALEQKGLKPERYEQRFSNGQAVLALRQLNRLDQNLSHRRSVAGVYGEILARSGYKVPNLSSASEPSYVRFPVMVQDRSFAMQLASRRVVLGQWFNSVLEESRDPSDGGYVTGSCPHAEFAAEHLINLPTHPRVKTGDVEEITSLLERLRPAEIGL